MNMFTHTVTIFHKNEDNTWSKNILSNVHVERIEGETVRKRGVDSTSKLIAYIKSKANIAISKGDVIYCGICPLTNVKAAKDILYDKAAFLVTSAEYFDYGGSQRHYEVVAK